MNFRERQVQAAWYDSEIRPRRLFTSRGSEVRVISPGEWNAGAGPDFKNAVLEVGAAHRQLIGDVEIHLCPADWDLHNHGADPNYRNVVAHVTWKPGKVPDSLPEAALSIFLGRFMTASDLPSANRLHLLAYPYAHLPLPRRPCERRLANDPELAKKVMSSAGRHRLRMKARRLLGRLSARTEPREQLFYEEVMTALGYSKNTAQFRSLAERVPLRMLLEQAEVAETMLESAAGFESFERGRCRPNNDPMRRVKNAARLFVDTEVMSLADQFDFSPGACKSYVRMMTGGHCMGRGRAGAVLANVIVPFAIAEGRIDDSPEWLPPEDISSPVRLAASRLLGPNGDASLYSDNDLLIQGIIQIHRDYCLRNHPDCEDCRLAL